MFLHLFFTNLRIDVYFQWKIVSAILFYEFIKILVQKFIKFLRWFFGKFKTSKSHYEINRPLERYMYIHFWVHFRSFSRNHYTISTFTYNLNHSDLHLSHYEIHELTQKVTRDWTIMHEHNDHHSPVDICWIEK